MTVQSKGTHQRFQCQRIKSRRHSYLDKEETETKSRIVYRHVFNASYAHDQLLDPRHPQPNVVRLRSPRE